MTYEAERYVAIFALEYQCARQEYHRLCSLLRDVLWYNFEVAARSWKRPWRTTLPDSWVTLHGTRVIQVTVGKTDSYETGYYPLIYEGPVCDAPSIPVEILTREVQDAREYMNACQQQITAPMEWAPGGALYNALARTTRVGRRISSANSVTDGGGSGE